MKQALLVLSLLLFYSSLLAQTASKNGNLLISSSIDTSAQTPGMSYMLTVNKPFELSCSTGNQLTINVTHHNFLAIGPSYQLLGVYANWEDDQKLYPNFNSNYNYVCTPKSSVEEKFLAQNVFFYLNHLVHWMTNEIVHFQENYYQSIVFDPVNYNNIFNYVGVNGIGDLFIEFGSNENPNFGYHYAFNPDYIVGMGILVLLDNEFNYTTIDDDGVYWGLVTTLTRIYWEDFAVQFGDTSVIRDTMFAYGGRYQRSLVNESKPYNRSLSYEVKSNIWASTLYNIYTVLGKEKFFDLIFPAILELNGKVNQEEMLVNLQYQMHMLLQNEGIFAEEYCEILSELHYRYSPDSVTNAKLNPIKTDYFIKDAGEVYCPVLPVLPDTNVLCLDNDRGAEPNIESSNYHSSSIWNCPTDNQECSQHVNPVYENELTANYLKVRVHPIYPCRELEGHLRVYAALPTTTQNWDSWGGNGHFYTNLSCGEEVVIGRRVGEEIELSDTTHYTTSENTDVRTYTIPWIPFNPKDFECDEYYDGKILTTNILATIDAYQDSLHTEVEDIVKMNNNAAVKNMTILGGDNLIGEEPPFYFLGIRAKDDSIGLNDKGLKSIILKLKISELGPFKDYEEMFSNGRFELDLSQEFLSAWTSRERDSGYHFLSQDTNVIRITSAAFTISELQLLPGKIYPISIKYLDSDKEYTKITTDSIIRFSLEQFNINGGFEGGQEYLVESTYKGPTHTKLIHTDGDISIYPNPTKGQFITEINGKGHIESVTVYSSNSLNVIKTLRGVYQKSCRIDLKNNVPGIYYIKVQLKDGTIRVAKVVKI